MLDILLYIPLVDTALSIFSQSYFDDDTNYSNGYDVWYDQVITRDLDEAELYDSTEEALCKVKKDGSSKKVVSTFVNNEMYNVTSKKIYFYDAVNQTICSSDTKGKTSKVVVSIKSTKPKINIVDGIMYYLDDSKNENQIYQMYRIKTNGGKINQIEY